MRSTCHNHKKNYLKDANELQNMCKIYTQHAKEQSLIIDHSSVQLTDQQHVKTMFLTKSTTGLAKLVNPGHQIHVEPRNLIANVYSHPIKCCEYQTLLKVLSVVLYDVWGHQISECMGTIQLQFVAYLYFHHRFAWMTIAILVLQCYNLRSCFVPMHVPVSVFVYA